MLEGRQSRTAVIAWEIVCADFLLNSTVRLAKTLNGAPGGHTLRRNAHEVTAVQNILN